MIATPQTDELIPPCRCSAHQIDDVATPDFIFFMIPPPTRSTLFPYTTLFRSLLTRTALGGRVSIMIGFGATLAILRSEEHTSELQSRLHLVCRLLLEKKKEPVQPSSSD